MTGDDRRSWLRRLRFTPLVDLLRGRLTGRLDVRALIDAAGLPDSVSDSIARLAWATRVRRIEQIDVARRLIEQVGDRLAAGATPDEAVESLRLPGEVLLPEAEPIGRWRRIASTPLVDLCRGRLTSRLSVRGVIHETGLPQPLADVVYCVCRKTRLWLVEQVDVARELAEHFQDGLAAGKTEAELRREFGDAAQAARLIRRARRRCRPLAWKLYNALWKMSAATTSVVMLLYLIVLLRMAAAAPNLQINIKQEFVARQCAIPEEVRAWPEYRAVFLELHEKGNAPDFRQSLSDMTPDDWRRAKEFLAQHQPLVERLREATRRPRLGYYYGDPGDQQSYSPSDGRPRPLIHPDDGEVNPEGYALTLAYIEHLGWLERLLEADARRALEAKDGATLAADISALLRMSRHLRDGLPSLISELVAIHTVNGATKLVRDALTVRPALLSDQALIDLAHELASPWLPLDADVSVENRFFEDMLQRLYSDDDHGNGLLTLEGLATLKQYSMLVNADFSGASGKQDWESRFLEVSLAPAAAMLLADRREMRRVHDRLLEMAQARAQQPRWRRKPLDIEAELKAMNDTPVPWKLRYAPITISFPAVDGVLMASDYAKVRRDASQTALALELYHRRHHKWPATLLQLVPQLLPGLPIDPFDGEPIRYRLTAGKPHLYSVGMNRRDDGGRNDLPEHWAPDRAYFAPPSKADDWQLWPTVPPEPKRPPRAVRDAPVLGMPEPE